MAISKKLRFEIFKRDSFTCQYCGRQAPSAVLQIDHIHPSSKGGEDDILNYLTSCLDCNQGKKDRLLSDDTVVKMRKKQLDELQKRREQLEMLMEWHKSLINIEAQTISQLSELWSGLVFSDTTIDGLTKHGKAQLKRWAKRFGVNEVVEAMKVSSAQYLEYGSNAPNLPTLESLAKAFDYIPRICANKRKLEEKPYLKDLYYIRGILKNRLYYVNQWQSIQLMEQAVRAGVEIEEIKTLAKEVGNWSSFRDTIEFWTKELLEEEEQYG